MADDLAQRLYEMLLESAFWPVERLREHRENQLGHLLHFARNKVPFYATRLDPLFTPSGDIDWSRWRDLVPVTRQDLIAHGPRMRPDGLPQGHGDVARFRTSGTTGPAVEVATNGLATLADRCVHWRDHKTHKVDWSEVYGYRTGNPDLTMAPVWGPPWDRNAQKGRLKTIDRTAAPETVLREMVDAGVRYTNGGARSLHTLAADARRLGVVPKLHVLFAHGERVAAEDRAICREVFGARVMEMYSSIEGHQMASQCPEGGLHLNAETVVVEILDPDGEPCAQGAAGDIVVTPFFNSAQPLIRYAQGDRAEVLPACSCGRTSPRIRILGGRVRAIFSHPDGRILSQFFTNKQITRLGLRQFQLAQTGPLDFEFRYVPVAEGAVDEADLDTAFRALFFADARLRTVRLERFVPGPNDKHVEYRNEWAQPQAAPDVRTP